MSRIKIYRTLYWIVTAFAVAEVLYILLVTTLLYIFPLIGMEDAVPANLAMLVAVIGIWSTLLFMPILQVLGLTENVSGWWQGGFPTIGAIVIANGIYLALALLLRIYLKRELK